MKFLITFTLAALIVFSIPHEEYKVSAKFSDSKGVERVTSKRNSGKADSSALSSPSGSEKKLVREVHAAEITPKNELEQMICDVFGTECSTAIAIATAESGLVCEKRSYAMNTNGTYDHGLFQINDIHKKRYPDANFYDCETNIRIAKEIRDSWHGWHAWSVFNNKTYYQFIKQ